VEWHFLEKMMIEKIKKIAAENKERIVDIRREIHSNPELSFEEYETSALVCDFLDRAGIKYEKGVVKTGVVALIEGNNPTSKIVALRADLDALPIQETTDLFFKSKNEGKMHACGHDVHTASLLGTALILHELSNDFEGTIKLIFQPGEERIPGGAKLMIEEGVLENPSPSNIIGQHVYPELEAGKVGFKPGMYMASADELHVKVIGKGGHAALPHNTIDPVLITSHIIVALQQLISRRVSPYSPSVLSFGSIHGDGATNIIPDEVNLQGTFRAFDEEWRAEAHGLMIKMAESIAEGMGGKCEFEVRKGYPFLVNDEDLTNLSKKAAIDFLGEENVIDLDLRMTAEDFAYYSQVIPSCFYRLGTSDFSKPATGGLHTPTFTVDEKALETGMGLMAYLALMDLKRN